MQQVSSVLTSDMVLVTEECCKHWFNATSSRNWHDIV